jgi:hypothetical protein
MKFTGRFETFLANSPIGISIDAADEPSGLELNASRRRGTVYRPGSYHVVKHVSSPWVTAFWLTVALSAVGFAILIPTLHLIDKAMGR